MSFGSFKEGDLFLMGQGESGTFDYVSGLYRAKRDLDWGRLQAQFLSIGTNVFREPETDITILMGENTHFQVEANFQTWLTENELIERLPCALVGLRVQLLDKHKPGSPEHVIKCDIRDPSEGEKPSFTI